MLVCFCSTEITRKSSYIFLFYCKHSCICICYWSGGWTRLMVREEWNRQSACAHSNNHVRILNLYNFNASEHQTIVNEAIYNGISPIYYIQNRIHFSIAALLKLLWTLQSFIHSNIFELSFLIFPTLTHVTFTHGMIIFDNVLYKKSSHI